MNTKTIEAVGVPQGMPVVNEVEIPNTNAESEPMDVTVDKINALETETQEPQLQNTTKGKKRKAADKEKAIVFNRFVGDLKRVALRGDEAMKESVAIINDFQTRLGKSRKMLTKLAEAIGVEVTTLYRWKKIVEKPATVKEPKAATPLFERLARILRNLTPAEVGAKQPAFIMNIEEAVTTTPTTEGEGVYRNEAIELLRVLSASFVNYADRLEESATTPALAGEETQEESHEQLA